MNISNTSYTMFWSNPEKFRLYKLLGLDPNEKSLALLRGTYFHLLAEQYVKGYDDNWLSDAAVHEGVTDEAKEAALLLFPTLKDYIDNREGEVLYAEPEININIGKHIFYVRPDAIIKNGIMIFANEYKTAGAQRKLYEFEKEWRANTQAEAAYVGAEQLGHTIQFVDVVIVQEGTPPILSLQRVTRTNHEIKHYLRAVEQTADIIEFLIDKWGIEKPWPHVVQSIWNSDMRGACNNKWCEYQDVCRQELTGIPEGFKLNEKHAQETKELLDRINNTDGNFPFQQ